LKDLAGDSELCERSIPITEVVLNESLFVTRSCQCALRSTLWLISYYTNMNGSGPTLRDLKIAIGLSLLPVSPVGDNHLGQAFSTNRKRPVRNGRVFF
jgi:hypothetical protein